MAMKGWWSDGNAAAYMCGHEGTCSGACHAEPALEPGPYARPDGPSRRFRVLNVLDDVTRECLTVVPDKSTSDRRVVRELVELIAQHGKSGMIVSDDGTELINAVLE